jgi:hypothetical protein
MFLDRQHCRTPLKRSILPAFFAVLLLAQGHLLADTILRFDFGGSVVAGDFALNSGVASSNDDGDGLTVGLQTTGFTFDGFLNPYFADISAGASLSIGGISTSGSPFVSGPSVLQGTNGGTFEFYDASNQLLLSGALAAGILSGATGDSTAVYSSAAPATLNGGLLLPYIDANSAFLTIALGNVRTGSSTGLAVGSSGLLNFTANATGQLDAFAAVPEPTTLILCSFASLPLLFSRQRTRRAA